VLIPEVTICIPAWQAAGFIDRTIQCARGQTHADIRITVSVDRSEDATEEICREHARSDERVEVISQGRRLGWAANANALLDRVDSEFFFLYFHDDIIEPGYTEVLLDALRERPEAGSAHCHLERFGNQTGVMPANTFDGSDTRRLLNLLVGPVTGTPLRSLTRSTLLDAGLRFPLIGSDGPWRAWPYTMMLIAAGPALGVPEVLYRRWYREGSLTADWGATSLEPVIEGQRLQAGIALDIIEAAVASPREKGLLRFCLYLRMVMFTRRQELRLGCPDLVPPHLLADAFPGDLPAEALAALEPEQAQWVSATHAQLLFLEGRHALEHGDPGTADEKLKAALQLDPGHPRAGQLLAKAGAAAGTAPDRELRHQPPEADPHDPLTNIEKSSPPTSPEGLSR